MTAYQDTPYYYVDSPLNQPEEEWGWEGGAPADPMASVQQRMVLILSAALRGVPEDTIEAAIIDGANPFQIFFKIKVPQIMGTIVVVWTTITITVLKVFDIVLEMTNGQWETQVLANYMYDKLFRSLDWGMGSASAMIIMALVTPILVWNVWNARKEMR